MYSGCDFTVKTLALKKLRKEVKRTIPWIKPIVESTPKIVLDLLPDTNVRFTQGSGSQCVVCKGSRLLCGKTQCPVIARVHAFQRTNASLSDLQLSGSSPPGVFVGRFGYPHVYLGPLVPSYHGNTAILDQTESWFDFDLPKILDLRSSLVRGMFKARVTDLSNNKILTQTRELTLSRDPADTEMSLKRSPRLSLEMDAEVQPMGPSGPISKLSVDLGKTDFQIEKAYYDSDLLAQNAVINLYTSERVLQSSITRAFSVGMFGQKKKRRLVPTRWTITAVDSMLGIHFLDSVVRTAPWINEFRVFEGNHYPEIVQNTDGTHSAKVGNRFIILMIPGNWSYEAIEAFFPGSSWNPGTSVGICGDWEPYQGRTTYARIGGCYYTARLRVAEY